MKTCINRKLHRLTLEKMVIGLEEPILVKGVGEFLAKIDSGNSGYNVIHGEDFIVQGNILNFKTINKDGDERRVSKKIKETLRVNIGGGHIQERPVIELDIKFAGDDYKKIPFSVTNRADNEHKVLISKDFVGKELKALIDVTKDNIANDDINVDYVTEGILDAIKGAAKTAGNVVSDIATGPQGLQNFAAKMSSINKAMQGEYVPAAKRSKTPEIDASLKDEVKSLGKIGELIEADKQLILAQLQNQESKFPDDFGATISKEAPSTDINGNEVANIEGNVEVQKLLDYTGNTNIGGAQSNPDYHARMKKVLKAYSEYMKNPPKDESEETVVSEATVPQQTQASATSTQNTQIAQSAQKGGQKKQIEDPTKEIQGVQKQKDVNLLSKDEVLAELSKLKKRNQTIFYLLAFKTDNKNNQLLFGAELTSGIQNIIDSWSLKLVQSEQWTKRAFMPFVTQLVRSIDKNAKGLFAICFGPAESRSVEFFTNPGLFYTPESEETAEENISNQEELAARYDELNAKFKELTGMDLTDENLANYHQNSGPDEVQLVSKYTELSEKFKNISGMELTDENLANYVDSKTTA